MIKEMIKDFSYPIEEMGVRIGISKKDSLEGKIEFSAGIGLPSVSYPIIKDIDNMILVPKTIKYSLSDKKIVPEFVIFRTSENSHSLTVDIYELEKPIRTLGFLFRRFFHILPK
jgi:hypothetical protein